jgi:hypothetical protein
LFREVGEGGVLLNLESERYYILDDVGTRMWELLTELGDVTATAERLLDEYDVDEALLRRDLASLVNELAEAGLIVVQPTGA